MELGKTSTFVAYDRESQVLSILKGATGQANIDSYPIELQLIDALGVLSEIYTISLDIVEPESDEAVINDLEGVVPVFDPGAFYASLLQDGLAFKEIDSK